MNDYGFQFTDDDIAHMERRIPVHEPTGYDFMRMMEMINADADPYDIADALGFELPERKWWQRHWWTDIGFLWTLAKEIAREWFNGRG